MAHTLLRARFLQNATRVALIFTAEADQLELLAAQQKRVTVPEVLAVGSDRDYSLVMEYSPSFPSAGCPTMRLFWDSR